MKLSRATRDLLLARPADGLSPYTLIDYERTLRMVTEFLDDPEIESITTGSLRRYMEWLPARGVGAARTSRREQARTCARHHLHPPSPKESRPPQPRGQAMLPGRPV